MHVLQQKIRLRILQDSTVFSRLIAAKQAKSAAFADVKTLAPGPNFLTVPYQSPVIRASGPRVQVCHSG